MKTKEDERWMRRSIEVAHLGAGPVSPNPMVGAVLVDEGRVLAEGWHRAFGGPHAEVECLRAFGPGPVPADATLYVNLEPCAHQGKTPPCVDLLIERDVKQLVVAHGDPDPLVHGRGFARARAAGMDVRTGVCEAEARWLNRRFLTFHEKHRPYIILKWARSADGFIDRDPRSGRSVQRISSPGSDILVHRWRSEEQAIVVGSRTVINDDPQLTVRHVRGRSPLRVVIDRTEAIPDRSRVFDPAAPTLLLTYRERKDVDVQQAIVDAGSDPLDRLMAELMERQVISALVEGGAGLLKHFLERGLWDEVRMITSEAIFQNGTASPVLDRSPTRTIASGADRIDLFANGNGPEPTWAW